MPDPTPQIVELSNQFRAQLLARERRAASAMVRYYGESWRRLQGDIRTLQTEHEQRRQAGEELTKGQTWRLERMQAIQSQVEQELGKFAPFAAETVAAGQRESIEAGQRNAYDLVQASFLPEMGVQVNFATMPRAAVEQMVGFLADGSPLNDVIAKYTTDASGRFGETLVTGLVSGWNPRKLARELRASFGMGLTESLRLARTEQLRAYRTATLNTYRANSHVVKAWERHAAHDARTCLACLVLDGKRYTLEEEMDDHISGRCALLVITKTYAELGIDAPEPDFSREKGIDWFQRQDEATQRQMMGPGKWQAWKDGKFTLEDIPKVVKSDVWGDSWVPKGLRELVEAGDGPGIILPPGAEIIQVDNPYTDLGMDEDEEMARIASLASDIAFELDLDEDLIAQDLTDWAIDSQSRAGLVYQVAAEKEFGAEMSSFAIAEIEKMGINRGADFSEEQAVLRYIYDASRREVGEGMTLYRGTAHAEANALESWTTDPRIAAFYVGREGGGFVIKKEFSAPQILGTYNTGIGLESAKEVVVINR